MGPEGSWGLEAERMRDRCQGVLGRRLWMRDGMWCSWKREGGAFGDLGKLNSGFRSGLRAAGRSCGKETVGWNCKMKALV
jgi:hypothetical protein